MLMFPMSAQFYMPLFITGKLLCSTDNVCVCGLKYLILFVILVEISLQSAISFAQYTQTKSNVTIW